MFFSGEGMVGERKCAQASHQVSQARIYRGIVSMPKRPTRCTRCPTAVPSVPSKRETLTCRATDHRAKGRRDAGHGAGRMFFSERGPTIR